VVVSSVGRWIRQIQLHHMGHRLLKCAKDNLRYPTGTGCSSVMTMPPRPRCACAPPTHPWRRPR